MWVHHHYRIVYLYQNSIPINHYEGPYIIRVQGLGAQRFRVGKLQAYRDAPEVLGVQLEPQGTTTAVA